MITADELLGQPPQRASRGVRLEDAIAFLRRELTGHDVQVTDLEAMAQAIGISERTLNRARDELGLRPRRVAGRWWLSLHWTRDNAADDADPDPPPPPASPAPPPPCHESLIDVSKSDDIDDSAMRFSLIELDVTKRAIGVGTVEPAKRSESLEPRVPPPIGTTAGP